MHGKTMFSKNNSDFFFSSFDYQQKPMANAWFPHVGANAYFRATDGENQT
jgi:hypothetical protein